MNKDLDLVGNCFAISIMLSGLKHGGRMPVYDFQCANEHVKEVFVHVRDDLGCETIICNRCGHGMAPVSSYGRGLLFFEEGRGRWIENLGPEPVYITSKKQHAEVMKKRGVEEAPADMGFGGGTGRISSKGRWV